MLLFYVCWTSAWSLCIACFPEGFNPINVEDRTFPFSVVTYSCIRRLLMYIYLFIYFLKDKHFFYLLIIRYYLFPSLFCAAPSRLLRWKAEPRLFCPFEFCLCATH